MAKKRKGKVKAKKHTIEDVYEQFGEIFARLDGIETALIRLSNNLEPEGETEDSQGSDEPKDGEEEA